MEKDKIKWVIMAQRESHKEIDYVERDIQQVATSWSDDPFVRIVAGVRRCGKSTLMDHIRKNSPENNYALNFDDNRLTGFNSDDFEKLFESFHELFDAEKTWFFDEIQNIYGWEKFVRRLHNDGHKVYITGSNSRMLSTELGTHLTGRYIQSELFPFSFSEFLRFKKIAIDKNTFYSPEKTTLLKKTFREFVADGGFPDYLQTHNANYLKTLYENIIYRDVIARFNIRNAQPLIEMLYFLISNISKESTYNALKNTFGISNANTVKEYISYFENSYLLFTVKKFDYSIKKQLANAKKIYTIDSGLANSISFKFSDNFGRQLENIVFLQLRRQGNDIYYHKNKHECDFVIYEKGEVVEAIQVCQSIVSEATRNREVNGLVEAMQDYKLQRGFIVTQDDEEELVIQNEYHISVLPAWKWLLEYKNEGVA